MVTGNQRATDPTEDFVLDVLGGMPCTTSAVGTDCIKATGPQRQYSASSDRSTSPRFMKQGERGSANHRKKR
jgi:hypothetical protein